MTEPKTEGAAIIITQHSEDGTLCAYEINWHGLFDETPYDAPSLVREHVRTARTIEEAERKAYRARDRYREHGIDAGVYIVVDGESGMQPYDAQTVEMFNEERPGAAVVEGNPRKLAMPRQARGAAPVGRQRALRRRWNAGVLNERGLQFVVGADGRHYWRKRDPEGRTLDGSMGGFDSRADAEADADQKYPKE